MLVRPQEPNFFAADILPQANTVYRVLISGSGSQVLEVTLNSGTDWTKLNGGTALATDLLFAFDIDVKRGDAFNLRQATGTVTMDILRIVRHD